MTDAADDFEFRHLRCYAETGDPRAYRFVSTAPDVQRDDTGRPAISFLEGDRNAFLMLSATWGAGQDVIDALHAVLDSSGPRPLSSPVTLAPATVLSPRCLLLLGPGDGSFGPISTSPTSGIWPYSAVFAVTLRGDAIDFSRQALAGEPDRLAIEYVGDVARLVHATATLRLAGSTLDDLRRRPDWPVGQWRTFLEHALETGLAALTVDAPPDVPPDIVATLRERVLVQGVLAASEWGAGTRNTAIHVTTALERRVRQPIRARTDIGRLMRRAATQP